MALVLVSTVATAVLLLLHVPPVIASPNVIMEPAQTVVPPDIDGGIGFTVTVIVLTQPEPSIYVIIVVPGATPVTVPKASTVALAVLLLLHVPALVTSINIVVAPTHTLVTPLIDEGNGFTVKAAVVLQPVGNLYEMIAVPLTEPPVAVPDVIPIVAVLVALLLHVPPVLASVKLPVDPEQIFVAPDINDGEGLMVTLILREHPLRPVYMIVSIPGDTPVTLPEPAKTVAMLLVLLLHVPPVVASPNIVPDPSQAEGVPDIDSGNVLTVTTAVVVHPASL